MNGRLVWNGTRAFAYGTQVADGYVVLTGAPARASISSQAVGAVPTTQVRVVVTASQTQNGNFTRIAELTP